MEKNKTIKDVALDKLDRQIIDLLTHNAKLNNKELATQIGLTVTPTFERVKRLERLGVIAGYKAEINPKLVGKGLKVVCQVSLKSHFNERIDEFEAAVKQLKEISQAYHVTGNVDYLLTVEVEDVDAFQDFVKNRLATIPHIGQVNSSIVMSALK
jgi:DNA-binding Lrp family transcriptional regulator